MMSDKEYTLWCSVYLKAMDLVAVNGAGPDCQLPYKAAGQAVLYYRWFINSIDQYDHLTTSGAK